MCQILFFFFYDPLSSLVYEGEETCGTHEEMLVVASNFTLYTVLF